METFMTEIRWSECPPAARTGTIPPEMSGSRGLPKSKFEIYIMSEISCGAL